MQAKVATIAAGVLAMASCGGGSSAAPATGTKVVAFVGDSNILLASPALSLVFFKQDDTYTFVFVARVGTGIRNAYCSPKSKHCPAHDYWRVRLGDLRRKVQPDAYVVDLGINDTDKSGTDTSLGYADYGQKVDSFMGLLGDRPVLWTNLPCRIELKPQRAGCKIVNAAVAAASSRHRNLTIIDWATVANPHPEWMGARGIHYTTAGYAALSHLVAKSLKSHFAR